MHKVDASLNRDLFAENQAIAQGIQNLLHSHNIRSFDFMGAIGSGKTLIIEHLIDILPDILPDKRVGVIVGDVRGDDDYQRICKHGVPVVNINTGKECHLDAHLIEHALYKLNLNKIDFLFIENIGNLVCPADFPLGTDKRVVTISVTEGDDMVRKHPLIFQLADAIIINKVDLVDLIDVDINKIMNDIHHLGEKTVFLTDARGGKGIQSLLNWLITP
jgi:hydrogenase nickel incorporation protein HypB